LDKDEHLYSLAIYRSNGKQNQIEISKYFIYAAKITPDEVWGFGALS